MTDKRAEEIKDFKKAYLMFDGATVCPYCGQAYDTYMDGESYATPSGGFEIIVECPCCERQYRASREYEQDDCETTRTESIDSVIRRYRDWFIH